MYEFAGIKVVTLILILSLSILFAAQESAKCNTDPSSTKESVDQTNTAGQFSVLSYNIDGLPQIIQSIDDGLFNFHPRNPGGHPGLYTPIIGVKAGDYDIVNVQEDFNSHNALYKTDKHPYRTKTSGGAGFGSGLNTLSRFTFVDDVVRVTWNTRNSTDGNNLTPKGFTLQHVRLAEGVYLDVYNLHTCAGTSKSALEARRDNIDQIVKYIRANSDGNAVLVFGDTNCRYTRAEDNIRNLLNLMDGDAWVKLQKNNTPPASGADALVWDAASHYSTPLTSDRFGSEYVDKIFYKSNKYIQLAPISYDIPDAKFRDKSGNMLSDHYPISAVFQYKLNPNYILSDEWGGADGTSFTDLDRIPENPDVKSIGIRSADRIDQISLTFTDGSTISHGGKGGALKTLTLEPGEYIAGATLTYDQYWGRTRIYSIKFITSKGRILSGGTQTGKTAIYTAPSGWQIAGFHGRSGNEADKIGFICTPAKSSVTASISEIQAKLNRNAASASKTKALSFLCIGGLLLYLLIAIISRSKK